MIWTGAKLGLTVRELMLISPGTYGDMVALENLILGREDENNG